MCNLIRATTDEHVWAESYNRKLDDVFGVEGEVAAAIADQFNAKLCGTEQKAVTDKPTENAAAYDAYLRGLAIEHNRFSFSAYQDAETAYAQATQLDPKFALAWSRVAVIRSFLYFNGVDPTRYTGASVKEAADRAMALRPDLGESWVAQGAYKYRVLRDFPAALAAYQEGRRRIPNNALVFEYLAYVERRMGHWKDAEEHYRKAAELDPLNLQLFISMGSEFFNLLRRFDEALAMLQRALQISPNDEDTFANIALIYQTTGRLVEALTELDKIPANATDPLVSVTRATQLLYERRFDDAVALLKRVVEAPAEGPRSTTDKSFLVGLGFANEFAGHKDEARATFIRAVQAIKPTPDSPVPPDSLGLPYVLALAYAGLGEKDKAIAQAREAVAAYETDAVAKPAAEIILAQIQARFGDPESAIAALPHLLTDPGGLNPADLRNDPMWDPIRKDPRFQKYFYRRRSGRDRAAMSAERSFFSELKRRNVYKVAVAYAVVAWLIIQIATQVFPFFEVPNWAVRLVVLVLVLGFPAALIFSWAFEITPEGIKLESEIDRNKSITRAPAESCSALPPFSLWSHSVFCCFNSRIRNQKRQPNRPLSLLEAKSIAVLPFDNLSRDPDNAFFADGVQDEILTRLAAVADLKVISRTSTEKYRSKPENLREIAQQLGVTHILEGSVQRSSDQVRITVQLINALTDAHLWAEATIGN